MLRRVPVDLQVAIRQNKKNEKNVTDVLLEDSIECPLKMELIPKVGKLETLFGGLQFQPYFLGISLKA
jgi:hypothetical protein